MYLDLHSYSCYHYFIFWFLRSSFEAIVDFDRPSFIGWKQRTLIRQQQQHIRTKCRVSEMSVIIIFFGRVHYFWNEALEWWKISFVTFPAKFFSFLFFSSDNKRWVSLFLFPFSQSLATINDSLCHAFSDLYCCLPQPHFIASPPFLPFSFLIIFYFYSSVQLIKSDIIFFYISSFLYRMQAKMINLILFYLSLSFSFTITVYLYFSLLSFSSLSF